jgi:hypothetical protein
MASTFSPTLRLELIGDGDQSGIWGQTTNNNLGGLLEQAITGVITISMVDANYTLANFNGVVDEARNQVLVLTGALSAQRNLIAPLVEKTYIIRNTTTGGFGVQIIGSSGTGVIIPNGTTASVFCDGTNFFPATTGSLGNQVINGNLSVTGTTTLTGALSGSTAVFSGAISSVNPSFTGTPTAPTAIAGTSTTQIATTAFVQNVAGALGTMSTQNANAVNITGGTLTGMTNVAGGTHSGTTATFSGAVSGSSFSGAGTGLTGTAGSLSIGGNAATATNATTAASCSGNSATASNPASGGSFITSSNIGSQSVNFANSATNATNATNATTATNANQFQGKTKLGLGITGELWSYPSRASGVTYTNSLTYPIAVSARGTAANSGPSISVTVNGVFIQSFNWQFNGAGAFAGAFAIVPAGATYSLTFNGCGIAVWAELF